MRMGIEISDLAATIVEELSSYQEETTKELEKQIKEVATHCKEEIQKKSPVSTGVYKKGWKLKAEKKNGHVLYKVYNVSKPQLTHLLEYGHVKQNGGRVGGTVHIRPAEEQAEKELLKKIKEIYE